MPRVAVTWADATERRLPLVSVRSGRQAHGYVAVPVDAGWTEQLLGTVLGRRGRVALLPLTQREFGQVQRLYAAQRRGVVGGVVFAVLGLAMARFPLLLPLGLTIAVVSFALTAVATFGLRRLLPQVSLRAGRLLIEGAHERFVARVEEGDRRYS